MLDSFKLTESRTDNPDVSEFVDDVVGPSASPAGSFDLVFATQTAFPQRESNAVATERLEIAHEGFLGKSDLLDYGTGNAEDSFVCDGHDCTSHPSGIQIALHDGSVRLAEASDSFVNFDGNSQPIGHQVMFTYTISDHAPMAAYGGYDPSDDDDKMSGCELPVLVFSHEEGANDSIWIDIGAPIMGASKGYVLTQLEHAAPNEAQSCSPGYGNPSTFQIISAGADEAGSRLFVGNLTMHSEASVSAAQTGGWIADVTYERLAGHGEGNAHGTETIDPLESDYSGAHALYQDVIVV
jgi:hypothetical protein